MRSRRGTAYSFNPLPPPKRGETSYTYCERHLLLFQSTPPAEARGDINLSLIQRIRRVSIHSPRRSEGRRHASPSLSVPV